MQTDHADDHVGPLLLRLNQLSQPRVHFVLSVLPNGAGVEQHQIGTFHVIDGLVSHPAKLADDQFAVQHVHLAAHRLQIDRLRSGKVVMGCGP